MLAAVVSEQMGPPLGEGIRKFGWRCISARRLAAAQ
jgi:hypothetical protein